MARRLLLALVVIAILAVGACTQQPSSSQPTEPAAAPQPTEPAAAPQPTEPAAAPQPTEPTATAGSASSDLKPIDNLVIVRGADLVNLHPNRSTDPDSQNVMRSMYEALVYAGPDLRPAPELAERWEEVDDSTYRFFLRKDVQFHNGQPFTADDVVYTYDQVNNPPEGMEPFVIKSYASMVEEVVKENDHQVLIKLTRPFPIALYNFSRVNIVPHTVPVNELAEHPIGTGPYEFVEWAKGSHVTVEANDDHWRGKPLSRKVTWKTVPEDAAKVAELLSGRAHIVTKISPLMSAQIEQNQNFEVKKITDAYIIHLDVNTYKPVMENPLVRQAIYHAIDRQALVNGVAEDIGTLINGPIIPQAFGYDPNFKDYEYDPEKAKALLAEAGYPDGIDIKIAAPQGRYQRAKEVSEAVAQQLTAVGIRTQVALYEWGVHLQQAKEKTTDELFFIGWSNAPFDYLQWYYHIPTTHQYSLTQSPEMEELIEQAGRTVETTERLELAEQLYEAWREYVPTIPLYQQTVYYGVKAGVAFEPRPDEEIRPEQIGQK